jgi:hypothetical protein
LASITPTIVCTADELSKAYTALSALATGARKVRVVINGDVTEWASVSLAELNTLVAGMQAHQNSGKGGIMLRVNLCNEFFHVSFSYFKQKNLFSFYTS